MSIRKVRTKIRGRATEERDCPLAASASSGQTKVVEYFPTIHRDQVKKFKRLKVFAENDEVKATKHTLESPKKMARLKSPQISEKKTESDSQKWVLPITYEAEVVPKSGKVNKSDNDADESSLEVVENGKLSTCSIKRITGTESKEKRKDVYDKIKHGTVEVGITVPLETETNKADSADLSVLPSAVKLVESIKSSAKSTLSDTLPLPAKYERLLRLFDYTEVVSWLETQGKRITLNEVMTNVQRKLKSNYNEQQFAMILSIYPESYNIRCERRWMPIGGRHCNFKEYEYVIEPNLINDLAFPPKENLEETSLSNSSPVKPVLGSPCKIPLISLSRSSMASPSMRTVMKSPIKSPYGPDVFTRCPPKLESHRLHRKLEFKSRLRKLVNIQHAAFLKNEGIEISPDEQLPRYHPDFDLDAVNDIIPANLPEMPKGDAGQPETMREYLKAVPDSSGTLPEKIKMVIKELRSPEKKIAVVADKFIPLSPKKYVETKNSSKPSLLERIRAKERERKQREMMRNPEMEQRKGRLERISHSLLQCICSYYNLKKIGSVKFAELIDKLAFSIGCISKVEIEAIINLLCEVCPTYFKIVEVRGEKYVHFKNNSFTAIRDLVNAEIKKCV
uniref:CDT1 domain-containing protein n=1 Tax=Loa loa TaxID=7209 RepID=A0A1I7VMY7_LOALO